MKHGETMRSVSEIYARGDDRDLPDRGDVVRYEYMANNTQVKIITPKEITVFCHPLPQSWTKAAGLLRHKRKALEQHLKKVRNEWGTPWLFNC